MSDPIKYELTPEAGPMCSSCETRIEAQMELLSQGEAS